MKGASLEIFEGYANQGLERAVKQLQSQYTPKQGRRFTVEGMLFLISPPQYKEDSLMVRMGCRMLDCGIPDECRSEYLALLSSSLAGRNPAPQKVYVARGTLFADYSFRYDPEIYDEAEVVLEATLARYGTVEVPRLNEAGSVEGKFVLSRARLGTYEAVMGLSSAFIDENIYAKQHLPCLSNGDSAQDQDVA